MERIKSCARLVKTLKRIGCRVQTKGISPANDPSPSPFPFFLYPSDYYPTDYFSQIYQEKSFPSIPHSRFSIFNSGKQISTFSKFAIPRGGDPILYGGGKKEERRWNTRGSPTYMIYDYALVSYYITDASSGRISYQRRERNCSSVCPFVDFAFYQKRKRRERERERFTYIRILVSDRSEKKRDSPRRYSISNAQQKFMLSLYHPCVIRKRKLVGNICIV